MSRPPTSVLPNPAREDVLFGDVLIEQGLITAEELRKVLQKNLAKKLLDGFSWLQGSYRFSDAPVRSIPRSRSTFPSSSFSASPASPPRSRWTRPSATLIGTPLALHPEPFFTLDEIRMSPRQSWFPRPSRKRPAGSTNSPRSTEIPYEELTRILYAFSLIGVVVTV